MTGAGIEIAAGLRYEHEGNAARVATDSPGARWFALHFSLEGEIVRTQAVVLDGTHLIDLSGHPAAVSRLVMSAADDAGRTSTSWLDAIARAVDSDLHGWGCSGREDEITNARDRFERLITAIRFPMLAAAYNSGATHVGEVPRWARPCLSAARAKEMAHTAFGERVTRAVTRAVGRWLISETGDASGRRLNWHRLGSAVAGAEILEPDDIASMLVGTESSPNHLPSVDNVHTLRNASVLLGRARYLRLVRDALTHGQFERLERTLRLLMSLHYVLEGPLPHQLDHLERVCLAVAAIDPRPPQPPAPAPHRPIARAPVPAPVQRRWTTPHAAPSVRVRIGDGELTYPQRITALDNLTIGEATLCLPRTSHELHVWGRLLGNCLGDFASAVRVATSVIVGVRVRGCLAGALEIRPDARLLVQFLGARNRTLAETTTGPVVQELERRGLLA